MFRLLVWLVLFPFCLQAAEPPFPTVVGSGTAVEGDVLSLNGQVVKLWGVDAPDLGQTCRDKRGQDYDCATQAKNMLQQLVGQNQIICYIRGKDSHGQQVGTCGINDLDLAALQVRSGWAMAYQDLSPQYVELEALAQSRFRGLWSGTAEAPWQWRSRQLKKP